MAVDLSAEVDRLAPKCRARAVVAVIEGCWDGDTQGWMLDISVYSAPEYTGRCAKHARAFRGRTR